MRLTTGRNVFSVKKGKKVTKKEAKLIARRPGWSKEAHL